MKELFSNSFLNINVDHSGLGQSGPSSAVALANEFLRQSTPDKLNARGISASEQAEIAIYREEARALRALAYYHLMDFFGKAAFNSENDAVGVAGPDAARDAAGAAVRLGRGQHQVQLRHGVGRFGRQEGEQEAPV